MIARRRDGAANRKLCASGILSSLGHATMTAPLQKLPKAVLLDLLPVAFEPWGSSGSFPSSPPTDHSVRRINAELCINLPPLFIEVARACPSYGGWFNSIGDD